MEKDTLKAHLVILTKFYDDFVNFRIDKSSARNAKQKSLVERKINFCLLGFTSYVERHSELFKLITGEGEITDFGRRLIWDDISSEKYFENEMEELLERINKIIKK